MPAKAQGRKATPPAVPQASENKYAPTVWGSNGTGVIEDLTVPSGQLCLVRRPGVEGLIKEGILKDFDTLTSLVQVEHIDRVEKGKRPSADEAELGKQIFADPDKFMQMIHVVDRVVTAVVMQPVIEMTPNDVTRREKGVVYADMIELEDKMFIFQYAVGGTRDIERFREEFEESVGSVELGKPLEHAAK